MKNNEKSEENREKKNEEKTDKIAEIRKKEEEEELKSTRTSSVFQIRLSRRGNIMLLSMFIVMLLMTHMELSYSTPFQVNVYSFIVFFKIFYFIAEEILFKVTCSNVMVSWSFFFFSLFTFRNFFFISFYFVLFYFILFFDINISHFLTFPSLL